MRNLRLLPAYGNGYEKNASVASSGHHPIGLGADGWPNYGNDAGGTRYSAAQQIDRTNVAQLKPAWTYRTGAMEQKTELVHKAAFEATPILVEDKLFLSTPYNHVIALNPQSCVSSYGSMTPMWTSPKTTPKFLPEESPPGEDPEGKHGQPCRLRIFMGTLDGRLIALDGETGKPCLDFGVKGEVNLAHDAATATEWTGGYQVTSAPAIAKDLVITGSSIADNWKVDTGRGIVRAFDARNGNLRWTWNPTPWAENTKPLTGAGNAWSTLSVDPEEDLVFVPTGSSAPDYYGGIRKGTTSGPTPWLPCAHPQASSYGVFRLFITTCGTMT